MPDRPDRVVHHFGPFRLDPHTLELEDQDGLRPLAPLPARILLRLVERAGEMVSRRELLELGWPRLPGAAQDSLNTCVRQIREALGDDASEPRYVETLRGRGYRLACAVRTEPVTGHGGRRRRLGPLVAAGAGVAAVALLVVGTLGEAGNVGPDTTIRDELTKVRYLMGPGFDRSGALARVDALLEDEPGLAEAHGMRSEILLFLGRRAEAWSASGRALSLEADEPTALRSAAMLHLLAGRPAEAEAAIDRSLAADALRTESWLARAYLTSVLARFDDAEEAIERALELDPLSPIVQGDVGLMRLWAGRFDQALGSCAEAVELESRAVWGMECAFDAAVLAGRTEDAARWGSDWMKAQGADAPAGSVLEIVSAVRRWRADRHRDPTSDPYGTALALLGVGDSEGALAALRRGAERPGFAMLAAGIDPRLEGIRDRIPLTLDSNRSAPPPS